MQGLPTLQPRSLVGRIFALYAATLLVFTVAALAIFYHYQFTKQIDAQIVGAELVMRVAAPTVADSAVIGDYDTIAKTLARSINSSNFAKSQFIDTEGGVIVAEKQQHCALVGPGLAGLPGRGAFVRDQPQHPSRRQRLWRDALAL